MATTTNYGWTTPDNTALVKDGASAIRTLGSSIDTTLKAQIDAQIPDTLLTTTGDTIYASAANTPARLGVGTTGQVLTVSAGLPAWATPAGGGGMTLISTTTLSGTLTTLSSIPQTYKSLYVVATGLTADTGNTGFVARPNNSATLSSNTGTRNNSDSSSAVWGAYNEDIYLSGGQSTLRTSADNVFTFSITNYTSTTSYKTFNAQTAWQGASSIFWFANSGGVHQSTSAITSLSFRYGGNNMTAGTVLLYGVS
jgi:hypothetical protein